MNLKAVIFDIDDTLLQTISCKWGALKETAKVYFNYELTDKELKKHWGIPFEIMIKNLFSDASVVDGFKIKYLEVSKQYRSKPHNRVSHILEKLKKKYILAALTSTPRGIIERDLIDAKIDHSHFSFIQTCEDTAVHKPDPRVFDPVFKKLIGMNKNQMMYVGDSVYDFQAAKGAGLNFAAVTTGLYDKSSFRDEGLGGEFIFKDFEELSTIF